MAAPQDVDLSPYRSYFKKVWVLEHTGGEVLKETSPLIGDGRFELVFVAGRGFKTIHDKHVVNASPGIYLGGQLTTQISLELQPETCIICLKLEPWTVGLLSPFPFDRSLNDTVPFDEINPVLNRQLAVFDFRNEFEHVLTTLGRALDYATLPARDFQLMQHACRSLEVGYADFKTTKQGLLDDSGLSARSMEQKFKKLVGLTPKKYANTIQMRRISEDIYYDRDAASLTELAYKHGFYDQAHFIARFRKGVGTSPRHMSSEKFFITDPTEIVRYYTI